MDSLQASFPYIFGVTTRQYDSDDCQNNLEGVIVVFLDYDEVTVPKSCGLIELRKGFVKKVEKQMEKHLPPPSSS